MPRRSKKSKSTTKLLQERSARCIAECVANHPKPSTTSERKLPSAHYNNTGTAEESRDADGYRIVHSKNIEKAVKAAHKGACNGTIQIGSNTKEVYGIDSVLLLKCDSCDFTYELQGAYNESSTFNNNYSSDLNHRLCYAFCENGNGLEALLTLAEVLNIPCSYSKETWGKHVNKLIEAHEKVVVDNITEARKELQSGSLPVKIPVSYDGTWCKRGHTANVGLGVVISSDTGKVIDYGLKSRLCSNEHFCSFPKKSPAYAKWMEEHNKTCDGAYSGSSGAMEVSIAKDVFENSKNRLKDTDHGLMYSTLICDGDSAAYNSVKNVYGVCGQCESLGSLTSQEKKQFLESEEGQVYEEQHLNDDIDCDKVIKLDCVNHVKKRLGKALRDLRTNTKGKLADGKYIGGKSHRLTLHAIKKLTTYYGNAILSATDVAAKTKKEKEACVHKMKTAIMASLMHCVMLKDKERHQKCPKDSWCSYKNTSTSVKNKAHHLDKVFLPLLVPIYKRLTTPALLLRCVPGYTQNQNESFNALVWKRAPKNKFHGEKRVKLAMLSAILHYNLGATSRSAILKKLGMTVKENSVTIQLQIRKDRERIRKSLEYEQNKAKQKARKMTKSCEEEQLLEKEGHMYEAGAFGHD